jgi:hypothetical protein
MPVSHLPRALLCIGRPQRIALVAIESELAQYLRSVLLSAWPHATVCLIDGHSDCLADLRICVDAPLRPWPQSTLWLAELDRGNAPSRLSARLWRAPMPATPARLVHAVSTVLAAAKVGV